MSAADPAPELPFCPACGNRDWHGPYCRVCKTELAAKLAEAERERERLEERTRELQMLAFKWMERHDRVCAGKPGGPFPSPIDLPESIARADRAEAALVAAQEAIEKVFRDQEETYDTKIDKTVNPEKVERLENYKDALEWMLPQVIAAIRALPIPVAKPEGEPG